MKTNSRSLVLVLSVLLLVTLSFTAFQAGQISALERGIEDWEGEFKKLEALATSELQKNDQQLKELAQDQERLEQECGIESDTYFNQRLEDDLHTLNVSGKTIMTRIKRRYPSF